MQSFYAVVQGFDLTESLENGQMGLKSFLNSAAEACVTYVGSGGASGVQSNSSSIFLV